jgi:hypothetical protein
MRETFEKLTIRVISSLSVVPAKAGIYEALEKTGFLLSQE